MMIYRCCGIALTVAMGLRMNAQNNKDGNTHSLLFTEVCVANVDQTLDHSNNYGGWVELYNPTAKAVSLDGWYISNNADDLLKHKIVGGK